MQPTYVKNYLNHNNVPLDKRGEVTDYIVAVHIFAELPIPSSPIGTALKVAYVDLHSATVNEKIDAINEEMVVNVDRVSDLVYQMWSGAYRTVHEPKAKVLSALALPGLAGADENIDSVNFARTFFMQYGLS